MPVSWQFQSNRNERKLHHVTRALSGSGSWMNPAVRQLKMPLSAGAQLYVRDLRLDLHEHAGRDDQAVQRFDGTRRRLEDVDHALVRAHLELLATLLVDVRAAEHGVALDAGRDGDRATDAGVGPLGMVDDLLRRRVQ